MDIPIGQRLEMLRNKEGLSQEQVASRLGVSRDTVSSYESGLREPAYDELIRLAHIYSVSVSYILGSSDEEVTVLWLDGLNDEERKLVSDLVDLIMKRKRQDNQKKR